MEDLKKCQTLEDAVGRVVICTDGEDRTLKSFDEKLGYYSVPIDENTWMSLGGTNLTACRRLFVGGYFSDNTEIAGGDRKD